LEILMNITHENFTEADRYDLINEMIQINPDSSSSVETQVDNYLYYCLRNKD